MRSSNSPGGLLDFVDGLDDDRLCQVGVEIIEPLLDLHWDLIGSRFEAALRERTELRKAFSCTMLDIADADDDRLRALIQPGEDVGTGGKHKPREREWWKLALDGPIRTVRVPELLELIDRAVAAGLTASITRDDVERVVDPGSGPLVWTRFRCSPPDGREPFYRCGVRLHLLRPQGPDAVFEVDLLAADVDALDPANERRIVSLLKSAMERLPGLKEV